MSKCKCHTKLVEAQAELAELELLPSSAFESVYLNGRIIRSHVDVKSDAIKTAKAKVAKYKVLATQSDSKDKQ